MRSPWQYAGLILATAIWILTWGLPLRASASDVYLAQAAAGRGDGADCNDAYAYTFFNTASNWGPGASQIGPGTTAHLCRTFSAPGGASGYLTFQSSGTSASPIMLLFESGAILTAPYWGSGGAISCGGNSFVTVNGGVNGIIQATANGTSPTYSNQQDGEGIVCIGSSNVAIKSVTIANIYVHTASPGDESGQETYGIDLQNGDNWTVTKNTIHDVKWAARMSYNTNEYSGWKYSNNTVYNVDHGLVASADGNSGSLSNLYVYGNTIHDFVNWDDNANSNHHDGIRLASGPSSVHGAYIYGNYVYGDAGRDCNALIYLGAGPGSNGLHRGYIFNNVLVFGSTINTCANGMIQDDGTTDTTIANNTLIGSTTSRGQGIECEEIRPAQPIVRNNILANLQSALFVGENRTLPVSDYNDFYGNGYVASVRGSSCCTTLSSWQSQVGTPDLHSISSNPNLNAAYVPQAGSPVIEYADNLTSLGITALGFDRAGIARPVGTCSTPGTPSCWAIGAYQRRPAPEPPSGLMAQPH